MYFALLQASATTEVVVAPQPSAEPVAASVDAQAVSQSQTAPEAAVVEAPPAEVGDAIDV